MKKELPQPAVRPADQQGHLVSVFIGAIEYEYAGTWHWDLHCEAVFCTDVIMDFPSDFEGTKGVIHPADKEFFLQRSIPAPGENLPFLQFRIITTWGEIKTLTGRDLHVTELPPFFEAGAAARRLHTQREARGESLLFDPGERAFSIAELLHKTGSWWLKLESNEMYYSDGVFSIYDLPPQSFNGHIHTFFPYIHNDDRDLVIEAFVSAFRSGAPLHLEYRIVTAKEIPKIVRLVTRWEASGTGAMMLYGAIQDITDERVAERQEKQTQHELQLAQRLLGLNEQSYLMGYWYVNLATRKVTYSDSIYRLYGVKPQSIGSSINIFLNYVHADDRDVVKEVTQKILAEHVPPDIEFRIVRSDGRVRYVRQKGRMSVFGEGEMILMVTLQDITAEKTSERKLAELQQVVSTAEFTKKSAEEMAAMGSWLMDMESGALTWSEGLYALLGLKTNTLALTQKALLSYIHPDDQKVFRNEWKLVLNESHESNFTFRMIRGGQVLHLCASFKIFTYGGRSLFIGTLQDLTKEEELKSELSQRIRMSEAITEHMPDRALLTDSENAILFWNRQAEIAFGIKREAALYKNFFEVFPMFKTAKGIQLFQRAWNGETVWMPHMKPQGGNEFFDLLMVPVRSDEGVITSIMHLVRDVTKEHEIERHLTERAHFIECLVDISVNRLIIMDRHMNYLYCNEQAAAYYGLSKEDIIGKNVLEVFPGSINDPTFDHFRKALKGERVIIPAIAGFLEEHRYEVHLVPIKDDAGAVTAVIWTHYMHDEDTALRVEG